MNKQKGFTLVELLIALALTAVLMFALFSFVFSAIKTVNLISTQDKRDQAIRFVESRIFSDFAQSSGWLTGSTSSKLVLSTATYDFNSGKVRRQSGNDSYYLTTEGELNSLRFFYPSQKLVGIELAGSRGRAFTVEAYARN